MRIVVIGGGASAMMFSTQFKNQNKEAEVIVFEKTPYVSWAGCPTPYYIAHELDFSHVVLNSKETFINKGIDVNILHEVVKVDTKEKYVMVKGSKYNGRVDYDKLVIAVGAKTKIPYVNNLNLEEENVFTLNHAVSAEKIDEYISNNAPKSATIVGMGFIGIELVESFQKRGMEVSVIEFQDEIFKILPEYIREDILKEIENKKVNLIKSNSVVEVIKKNNKIESIILKDGQKIQTDLLMFCTGITPNIEFLDNQLETKDGKILVNQYFETSVSDVYALGDSVYNKYINSDRYIYAPFGDVANKHGMMLAKYLSGKYTNWKGVQRSFATAFYDLKFAGTGLNLDEALSLGYKAKVVEMRAQTENSGFSTYKPIKISIIYDEEKRIVLGGFGVGYEAVAQFIDQISIVTHLQTKIDEFINMDFSYSPRNATVWTPLLVLYRKVIK